MLRNAGLAAGAMLAAPALAGCSPGSVLAQAQAAARPAELSVYLLGGSSAGGGGGGGGFGGGGGGGSATLSDLLQPMTAIVDQARKLTPGVSSVTFKAGSSDPSSWFPLPSTLYNVAGQQGTHNDDPSITMPDVVICMHPQMPNYLANRALDLSPYLKDNSATLQGIAAQALAQGMTYAVTRGTIQASLPLLRNPPLCVVPSTLQAAPGGKAWTLEQFEAALTTLATQYVQPNSPLLFIPTSLLAPGVIVGSGGAVAQSTGESSTAAFAGTAAAQGISTLIGWAQYASNEPFFRGGRVPQFGLYMGDGRSSLQTGKPPSISFGFRGGAAAPPAPAGGGTWQLAPLPVFPSRPAVPMTNNIDVMVFLHTKSPDAAAAFAIQLLSTAVQQSLLTYRGGLVLRAAQAVKQLSDTVGNVQGASVIADASNDIIDQDWMGGPQTDGNTQAWQVISGDLDGVFDQLIGSRDGNFGGGGGGPSYPALPAAQVITQTLQDAQTAANQGQPFPNHNQ